MPSKPDHIIVLIFLFSLCSGSPVSDKATYVSRYTPHREKPLKPLSTIHKTRQISHALSHKSPYLQSTSENSIHSIFSSVRRSLAQMLGFSEKKHAHNNLHYIKREEPADENWETDTLGLENEESRDMDRMEALLRPKNIMQNNLDHGRQLPEEDVNPIEIATPTMQEISRDDLIAMVRLLRKMFQGIELALGEDSKSDTQQSVNAQSRDKINDEAPANGPDTGISEREELQKEKLPDVRLALAQAAQLNKRREMERQQKLAELDDEQTDDVDYTESLPRSAPSYPTRIRLQRAAKERRWG